MKKKRYIKPQVIVLLHLDKDQTYTLAYCKYSNELGWRGGEGYWNSACQSPDRYGYSNCLNCNQLKFS
jgi:hypothetical protein